VLPDDDMRCAIETCRSSFRFSPCIIIVSHFYCPTNALNYTNLEVRPDRTHTPQVQNYAAKHRPSTRQNICESLRVVSVKRSSLLLDDGSHKI